MRTFSIMGDSISTFAGENPAGYQVFYEGERLVATGVEAPVDTWWAQVVAALGGTVLENDSWSGAMVEGAGFPACDSPERVRALMRCGACPDDVLVYCGINDYGWGGPKAQVEGGSAAAPQCARDGRAHVPIDPGRAPAGAAARFEAAYRDMLARMRAACPQARVWAFAPAAGRVRGRARSTFPRNFRGKPFAAYCAAVIDAAQATGCFGCDLDAFGYDYEALEGTHPTRLGMSQLAWLMLSAMHREAVRAGEDETAQATAPEVLGPYPGGASFRSDDPCDRPEASCIGCPHALATGSSWMHVCRRREP